MHLNLEFRSAGANTLGIATFVWELQLQLTLMARLHTDRGHLRYVEDRSMRAGGVSSGEGTESHGQLKEESPRKTEAASTLGSREPNPRL